MFIEHTHIHDKDDKRSVCEGGWFRFCFAVLLPRGNNCFALVQQLRPGQPQTSNGTHLPECQL